MSAVSEVKAEKDSQASQLVNRQHRKKINWFLPPQPSRNLRNVLEIKIGEVENVPRKLEIKTDVDDESVSLWQTNLDNSKKQILNKNKKKVAGKKFFFAKVFNHPYFNPPGIFSYCREDSFTAAPSNWFNKSLALVFAVFILAVVSSAYLIESGRTGNSKININIVQNKIVIKPSREVLANYIKVNNNWLQEQFNNGQDTIAIGTADLFGTAVDAKVIVDNNSQKNTKTDVEKIETMARDFEAKIYNYFSGLKNDQIDASLILNNTVANIFTK